MKWLGLAVLGCLALALFKAVVPLLVLVVAIFLLTLALRAPSEMVALVFVLVLLGAIKAQPVIGLIVLALVVLALVVEA